MAWILEDGCRQPKTFGRGNNVKCMCLCVQIAGHQK